MAENGADDAGAASGLLLAGGVIAIAGPDNEFHAGSDDAFPCRPGNKRPCASPARAGNRPGGACAYQESVGNFELLLQPCLIVMCSCNRLRCDGVRCDGVEQTNAGVCEPGRRPVARCRVDCAVMKLGQRGAATAPGAVPADRGLPIGDEFEIVCTKRISHRVVAHIDREVTSGADNAADTQGTWGGGATNPVDGRLAHGFDSGLSTATAGGWVRCEDGAEHPQG